MYHFMVNYGWSKVSFISLSIIRQKAALCGDDIYAMF